MKPSIFFQITIALIAISISACIQGNKAEIEKSISGEEYSRLMDLSLDDFDQSYAEAYNAAY